MKIRVGDIYKKGTPLKERWIVHSISDRGYTESMELRYPDKKYALVGRYSHRQMIQWGYTYERGKSSLKEFLESV
jgi:hypothetical protein